MKDLTYLDKHRVDIFKNGNVGDKHNGMFLLVLKGEKYKVMASNGHGWEHVSISHNHKIPSWSIMCIVKDMFFEEDEVVMQLHPKKINHINTHPNCLHLWKPLNKEIPVPPTYMV